MPNAQIEHINQPEAIKTQHHIYEDKFHHEIKEQTQDRWFNINLQRLQKKLRKIIRKKIEGGALEVIAKTY
jgi:hypothetical protein